MAELVAEPGPGGTVRLPVQRSQAPLILRRTADAVYLVGGAAGPLGGDTLELRIEVRAGATLRLRTVAAAVALPGRYGQESLLTVTATVGAGARLEYLPEPTVAADGARHRTGVAVDLAEDATLVSMSMSSLSGTTLWKKLSGTGESPPAVPTAPRVKRSPRQSPTIPGIPSAGPIPAGAEGSGCRGPAR